MLQAVTTLIAVVLGFFLSQLSEWARSRRNDGQMKRSVRTLVELERTKNIDEIERLWEGVLSTRSDWTSAEGEFLHVALARQLAKAPIPNIQKAVWAANIANLARVFEEDELVREWQLHAKLERLQAIHRRFVDADNERVGDYRHLSTMRGSPALGMISGIGFAESVRQYAVEFKGLVESILDEKRI